MFESICIAFAMYSKIPVPHVEWKEKNMKYAICFFPLVGVVLGLCFFGLYQLCDLLELNAFFKAVLLTALPVLMTGGIHLDGYCDTTDAMSSYQTMERRLEILKDSHTGAFAIIRCCLYYLLYAGAVSMLTPQYVLLYSICFFISRAFSGLSIVTFRLAKNTGLAATFSKGAHKKTAAVTMCFYLLSAFIVLSFIDWMAAVILFLIALLTFLGYRHMAYQHFGGTTGDLAGYFLIRCELFLLFGIIGMERIISYGASHWW